MTIATYKTLGRYTVAIVAPLAVTGLLWYMRPVAVHYKAIDEAEVRYALLERNLVTRPRQRNGSFETEPAYTILYDRLTSTGSTGAVIGYTNALALPMTNTVGFFPSSWLVNTWPGAEGDLPYTYYNSAPYRLRMLAWYGNTHASYHRWIDPPTNGTSYASQNSLTYLCNADWWNANQIGTNGTYWFEYLCRDRVLSNVVLYTTNYVLSGLSVSGTNLPIDEAVTGSDWVYDSPPYWTRNAGNSLASPDDGLILQFDPAYVWAGSIPGALAAADIYTTGTLLTEWLYSTNVTASTSQVVVAYVLTNRAEVGVSGGLNTYLVNSNVLNNLGQLASRMRYVRHDAGLVYTFGYRDYVVLKTNVWGGNTLDPIQEWVGLGETEVDYLGSAPGIFRCVGNAMKCWKMEFSLPGCSGMTDAQCYNAVWACASTSVWTEVYLDSSEDPFGEDHYFNSSVQSTVHVRRYTDDVGVLEAYRRPLYKVYHVNGDGMDATGLRSNPVPVPADFTLYCAVDSLCTDGAYPIEAGVDVGYYDFGLNLSTNHYNAGPTFTNSAAYPFVSVWNSTGDWSISTPPAYRGSLPQVDGFRVAEHFVVGDWHFIALTNQASFPSTLPPPP